MNTKQIWQALSSNPITEPFFDGVFPSDTVRNIKKKPELIICNTDPSNKPGSHWLLFFFHNDTVDFYDSLGKDLNNYSKDFINLIQKFANDYQLSSVRTQPINSSLCGYYCLYFAYKRCKGNNMNTIISSMKSSSHVVNFVNKHFSFCKSNNCSLFQKCIKY